MADRKRHTDNVPHLCGGIFFDLILEAGYAPKRSRDRLKGGSSGTSVTDVYYGLGEVISGPDWLNGVGGDALKKSASNYRRCISSEGSYVLFTDTAVQSSFESMYERQKICLLKRMAEFVDRFLNEGKCLWLVKALIETMQKDKEMD